jgi:glycosyltransferase involved in cell wall biosynthesis
MASGRPIVCTATTGIADLAADATEAMTVVATGDDAALAGALAPLLQDPDRAVRAGAEARALAVRRGSPAVVAAQKEEAYEAAIERFARRRRRRTGSA